MRNIRVFIFLLLIPAVLSPLTAAAADFYVSPNGSTFGDGSIGHPWDLQTALNHPATVRPGDTIWLRGGTYTGTYFGRLTGTAAAPLIVRGYPGERAVLDGSRAGQTVKNATILQMTSGGYVWLWDFEIMNSDPQRVITSTGSNPPDRRGTGLDIRIPGAKAINLVIHDAGQGISAYNTAVNFEAYGNLIYNNGWSAPDRNHGHGIYTQNDVGTKVYMDNIVLQQFEMTVQVYGSSAATLRNFNFIGNVLTNGRLLFGGAVPLENVIFDSNLTYAGRPEFGYNMNGGNTLTVTNNYLMSGLQLLGFTDAVMTNNILWGRGSSMSLQPPTTIPYSNYKFSNNTYCQTNNTGSDFRLPNGVIYTFPQWQQLGLDLNSTYVKTATPNYAPTGLKVFIRPNKYDSNRANIAVYNWANAAVVSLDLSSVLNIGDKYELRNARDYFGDVITGTYMGGSVLVDMNARTAVLPIGYTQPLHRNTFPEFGTFVLIRNPKTTSGTPPTPGIAVTVTPAVVALTSNQQQQFAATVSGATNFAVTWSIQPAVGTISSSGLYRAPATVTANQAVAVIATSVADPTKSGTAKVSLTASAGTVSSAESATTAFASFVALDTTTQGSWIGKYGSSGYYIAADGGSWPSYIQAALPNVSSGFWAFSTTDVRALQRLASTTRVASAWYDPAPYTFNINAIDGNTHRLAVYFADYDYGNRTQRIDLLDSATGTLLDSRTITAFANGQYLVWTFKGRITARVTVITGGSGLTSGFFFD